MFPVFINLGGMKALLVGGGNVALRRAGSLSAFSAAITVIAINACDGIKGMANSGLVSLQERAYEQGDESGFDICIAATNDARLNSEIALRAKSNGTRYYNDSSNSQNSNFFFPALVHKGAVTIGIASDGGHDSHLLVSETASRLRALLNEV
jgi:siroheme synthase-like protein